MLPGISSKLDLDDATMWHLCQEIFFVNLKIIEQNKLMPDSRLEYTGGDYPDPIIVKVFKKGIHKYVDYRRQTTQVR